MKPLQAADFLYQLPLLILAVTSLMLIMAEAFWKGERRAFLMQLTVAGCVGTMVSCIWLYRDLGAGEHRAILQGMLVADRFACFTVFLTSAATAAVALLTPAHQREHEWESGEYYGLLLLAATGMATIAMSNDLVAIFIGIELMSIAVYVLTAARWRSRRSSEAAMKYFLMGAFATGFLVYGIAMIYGATGTTNLGEMVGAVARDPGSAILIIGIFLLLVAFAFKVAAVPFHMWAPDAYEGAPTPVTGYMAGAVKAAAFVALLRVMSQALGGDVLPVGRLGWAGVLAVLAAITMTVGNIAAIRQDNIKRMLAYSSVSHAGVLLVGVVATGLVSVDAAQPAVLYYLAAYTATTIGAFGVVAWIGSRDRERLLVDDWNGLAGKHPVAALAMTVFMLSLGGLPPTAGFFGKFYIFKSAMETAHQEMLWLVVIGVLNSVISIFYYLRVVMAMYFKDPVDEFQPLRSGAVIFVLVVCALLVLQMGVMPGRWLSYAGG
jgi:NADH-quinone oxidoreductase subunit N